jgi:phage shock protein C
VSGEHATGSWQSLPAPVVAARSRTDRIIAGVCGGLAKRFSMDPTLVRVLYVLASILSAAFPGILVYVVLWLVIPEE